MSPFSLCLASFATAPQPEEGEGSGWGWKPGWASKVVLDLEQVSGKKSFSFTLKVTSLFIMGKNTIQKIIRKKRKIPITIREILTSRPLVVFFSKSTLTPHESLKKSCSVSF